MDSNSFGWQGKQDENSINEQEKWKVSKMQKQQFPLEKELLNLYKSGNF
jgi:hypothetical protein